MDTYSLIAGIIIGAMLGFAIGLAVMVFNRERNVFEEINPDDYDEDTIINKYW